MPLPRSALSIILLIATCSSAACAPKRGNDNSEQSHDLTFKFALLHAAQTAIGNSSSSQSNTELAEAVREAVFQLEFPGVPESHFPAFISVVVWDAAIPHEYEGDLLPGDPASIDGHMSGKMTSRNGMFAAPALSRGKSKALHVGVNGWPCNLGGAVAVTEHTAEGGSLKNCIVFYSPNPLPKQLGPYHAHERMRRFQSRLDATFQELPDIGPVDLTALAAKIYANYPGPVQSHGTQPNQWTKLRGVAVIPQPLHGIVPYGLASPSGLIIDVDRHITRLDLNGPPNIDLNVRVLAMFSANEIPVIKGR